MHYIDEGEGEAVFMVHGNPTWSFYYRNVVAELSKKFRCIAIDHIGCGLSDKPQDYPYRLENHIANASALIEHLGLEKLNLMVHDWGGPIGFGAAAKMPERIKKIVVLNTSAFLSDEMPFQLKICRMPPLGALLIRGFNAFAGLATTMAVRKPMDHTVKAGFIFPYDNWKNRIATLRFVEDIPMSAEHPSYATMKEIEAGLESLKGKPMWIGWGMHDFVFTESFLKGFEERFPDAEVHRFEGAGHYVLEDARTAIIPQIEKFLS